MPDQAKKYEIATSGCGLLAMTTFSLFMPFMFFMVKTLSPKSIHTTVIPDKAKPRTGIHQDQSAWMTAPCFRRDKLCRNDDDY
jgi:hypothetical protein